MATFLFGMGRLLGEDAGAAFLKSEKAWGEEFSEFLRRTEWVVLERDGKRFVAGTVQMAGAAKPFLLGLSANEDLTVVSSDEAGLREWMRRAPLENAADVADRLARLWPFLDAVDLDRSAGAARPSPLTLSTQKIQDALAESQQELGVLLKNDAAGQKARRRFLGTVGQWLTARFRTVFSLRRLLRNAPTQGTTLKKEPSPPTVVRLDSFDAMSRWTAERIAERIRQKPDLVLGLATGSTPLGVYKELIRLHRETGLDFSRVRVFHLDEYVGLPGTHDQSYQYYLRENFLRHVNVAEEHIRYLNGKAPDLPAEARRYEQAIREAGGIDIQILGIGRNGHIAFNEPGAAFDSRTRVVDLTAETIEDNSRFFKDKQDVPRRALSQGMATILAAKTIFLLANGEGKAPAVARAAEEKPSVSLPASVLQYHPDTTFVLDRPAASELQNKSPPKVVRRWLRQILPSLTVDDALSWKNLLRAAGVIAILTGTFSLLLTQFSVGDIAETLRLPALVPLASRWALPAISQGSFVYLARTFLYSIVLLTLVPGTSFWISHLIVTRVARKFAGGRELSSFQKKTLHLLVPFLLIYLLLAPLFNAATRRAGAPSEGLVASAQTSPENAAVARNALSVLLPRHTDGLSSVVLGPWLSPDIKDDVAGRYVSLLDQILLNTLNGVDPSVVVHEVGHHYYLHGLTDEQRAYWKNLFLQSTDAIWDQTVGLPQDGEWEDFSYTFGQFVKNRALLLNRTFYSSLLRRKVLFVAEQFVFEKDGRLYLRLHAARGNRLTFRDVPLETDLRPGTSAFREFLWNTLFSNTPGLRRPDAVGPMKRFPAAFKTFDWLAEKTALLKYGLSSLLAGFLALLAGRRGRMGRTPQEESRRTDLLSDRNLVALADRLMKHRTSADLAPEDARLLEALGVGERNIREFFKPLPTNPTFDWSLERTETRVNSMDAAFERFRANPRFSHFSPEDWRKIKSRLDALKTIEPHLQELAPGREIVSVIVHGSYLTDPKATPNDIDLVLLVKGDGRPSETRRRLPGADGLPTADVSVLPLDSLLPEKRTGSLAAALLRIARWGLTLHGEPLIESLPPAPGLLKIYAAEKLLENVSDLWFNEALTTNTARRRAAQVLSLLAEAGLPPTLNTADLDKIEVNALLDGLYMEILRAKDLLLRQHIVETLISARDARPAVVQEAGRETRPALTPAPRDRFKWTPRINYNEPLSLNKHRKILISVRDTFGGEPLMWQVHKRIEATNALGKGKRGPPALKFQTALSFLMLVSRNLYLPLGQRQALLKKLLAVPLDGDTNAWITQELCPALEAHLKKWGVPLKARPKPQDILLRSLLGISFQDRYYAPSEAETARVRSLLRRQELKPDDLTQHLLALLYANTLRFYPKEYLGLIPKNLVSRHDVDIEDEEYMWVGGAFRGGYKMDDAQLVGSVFAVNSELGHMFDWLIRKKHFRTYIGELHVIDRHTATRDYEGYNAEVFDRFMVQVGKKEIPWLTFDRTGDYVARLVDLAREALSTPDADKVFKDVFYTVFSTDRQSDFLKRFAAGRGDGVFADMTVSEKYYFGRLAAEYYQEETRGLAAAAALAGFRESLERDGVSAEEFRKEADQLIGIFGLSTHARPFLDDPVMHGYDFYTDEIHKLAERISSDFILHLTLTMHRAGVPMKVQPYLLAKAIEHIDRRYPDDTGRIAEKIEPVMPVLRLIESIDDPLLRQWLAELEKDGIVAKGEALVSETKSVSAVYGGFKTIGRLAKSMANASVTAVTWGAAVASLGVLLINSLWGLLGATVALPHLTQAALIVLAAHDVLPDRGLIPEWQDAAPLTPAAVADPSSFSGKIRTSLNKYRVAELRDGQLTVNHALMARLPHGMQRWIYRHEVNHLKFEHRHPTYSATAIGRWAEEFWVSTLDFPALVRSPKWDLPFARGHYLTGDLPTLLKNFWETHTDIIHTLGIASLPDFVHSPWDALSRFFSSRAVEPSEEHRAILADLNDTFLGENGLWLENIDAPGLSALMNSEVPVQVDLRIADTPELIVSHDLHLLGNTIRAGPDNTFAVTLQSALFEMAPAVLKIVLKHELKEISLIAKGVPPEEAHRRALAEMTADDQKVLTFEVSQWIRWKKSQEPGSQADRNAARWIKRVQGQGQAVVPIQETEHGPALNAVLEEVHQALDHVPQTGNILVTSATLGDDIRIFGTTIVISAAALADPARREDILWRVLLKSEKSVDAGEIQAALRTLAALKEPLPTDAGGLLLWFLEALVKARNDSPRDTPPLLSLLDGFIYHVDRILDSRYYRSDFAELLLELSDLLAWEPENPFLRNTKNSYLLPSLLEAFRDPANHGGFWGEVNGLHTVVFKRRTALAGFGVQGVFTGVNWEILGAKPAPNGHSGIKEFDAINRSSMFEFKYLGSLEDIYGQFAGIGLREDGHAHNRLLCHLCFLAQQFIYGTLEGFGKPFSNPAIKRRLSGLRNFVIHMQHANRRLTQALYDFAESRNIPMQTTGEGDLALKLSAAQVADFLTDPKTIELYALEAMHGNHPEAAAAAAKLQEALAGPKGQILLKTLIAVDNRIRRETKNKRQFDFIVSIRHPAIRQVAAKKARADADFNPLITEKPAVLAPGEEDRLQRTDKALEAAIREAVASLLPRQDFDVISRGSTARLTHTPGSNPDHDLCVRVPREWTPSDLTDFLSKNHARLQKVLRETLTKQLGELNLYPRRLRFEVGQKNAVAADPLSLFATLSNVQTDQADEGVYMLPIQIYDEDHKPVVEMDITFTNSDKYANPYPEYFAVQMAHVVRLGGQAAADRLLQDIRFAKKFFKEVVRAYKHWEKKRSPLSSGGPTGVGVEQLIMQSGKVSDDDKGQTILEIGGFDKFLERVAAIDRDENGNIRSKEERLALWLVHNPFLEPANFIDLMWESVWIRLALAARRYQEAKRNGEVLTLADLATAAAARTSHPVSQSKPGKPARGRPSRPAREDKTLAVRLVSDNKLNRVNTLTKRAVTALQKQKLPVLSGYAKVQVVFDGKRKTTVYVVNLSLRKEADEAAAEKAFRAVLGGLDPTADFNNVPAEVVPPTPPKETVRESSKPNVAPFALVVRADISKKAFAKARGQMIQRLGIDKDAVAVERHSESRAVTLILRAASAEMRNRVSKEAFLHLNAANPKIKLIQMDAPIQPSAAEEAEVADEGEERADQSVPVQTPPAGLVPPAAVRNAPLLSATKPNNAGPLARAAATAVEHLAQTIPAAGPPTTAVVTAGQRVLERTSPRAPPVHDSSDLEGVHFIGKAAKLVKHVFNLIDWLKQHDVNVEESLGVMWDTYEAIWAKMHILNAATHSNVSKILSSNSHLSMTLTWLDGVYTSDDQPPNPDRNVDVPGAQRVTLVHTIQAYFHKSPNPESEIVEGKRRLAGEKGELRQFLETIKPGGRAEKAMGALDEIILGFDARGYRELDRFVEEEVDRQCAQMGIRRERIKIVHVDDAARPRTHQDMIRSINELTDLYGEETVKAILEGVTYSRLVGLDLELLAQQMFRTAGYWILEAGSEVLTPEGMYVTELDTVVAKAYWQVEGQWRLSPINMAGGSGTLDIDGESVPIRSEIVDGEQQVFVEVKGRRVPIRIKVISSEEKSARTPLKPEEIFSSKVGYKMNYYKKHLAAIEDSVSRGLGFPIKLDGFLFFMDIGTAVPTRKNFEREQNRLTRLKEYLVQQEPGMTETYRLPAKIVFVDDLTDMGPVDDWLETVAIDDAVRAASRLADAIAKVKSEPGDGADRRKAFLKSLVQWGWKWETALAGRFDEASLLKLDTAEEQIGFLVPLAAEFDLHSGQLADLAGLLWDTPPAPAQINQAVPAERRLVSAPSTKPAPAATPIAQKAVSAVETMAQFLPGSEATKKVEAAAAEAVAPKTAGADFLTMAADGTGRLTLEMLKKFVMGLGPEERGLEYLLAQGVITLPAEWEAAWRGFSQSKKRALPTGAKVATGLFRRDAIGRMSVEVSEQGAQATRPDEKKKTTKLFVPPALGQGILSNTLVEVVYRESAAKEARGRSVKAQKGKKGKQGKKEKAGSQGGKRGQSQPEREIVSVRPVGGYPMDMMLGRVLKRGNKLVLAPLFRPGGKSKRVYDDLDLEITEVAGRPMEDQDIVQAFVKPHGSGFIATPIILRGKKITPEIAKLEIGLRAGARGYFDAEVVKQSEEVGRSIESERSPEKDFERLRKELAGNPSGLRIEDMMDKAFITIDPEGAGDLDDALHVEKHADGSYTWYLATADVGNYVLPGTPAFRTAAKIGNTFYMHIADGLGESPMNHPVISKYVASLLAGKASLAMITKMEFDAEGNEIKSDVFMGLVGVQGRYTYDQVTELWKGQTDTGITHLDQVALSRELASKLTAKDQERGKMDLEFPESGLRKMGPNDWRIVVEEQGPLLKESHRLIEELKVYGNQGLAKILTRITKEYGVPHLSRVHPEQDEEKEDKIREDLQRIGAPWRKGQTISEYLAALKAREDLSWWQKKALSLKILKSRMSARYDVIDQEGHQGLALEAGEYDHPSTPIRRFSDMYNQALLNAYLTGQDPRKIYEAILADLRAMGFADLKKYVEHLNARERAAKAMENELASFGTIWELSKPEYAGQRLTGYVIDSTPGTNGRPPRALVQLENPMVVIEVSGDQAEGLDIFNEVTVKINKGQVEDFQLNVEINPPSTKYKSALNALAVASVWLGVASLLGHALGVWAFLPGAIVASRFLLQFGLIFAAAHEWLPDYGLIPEWRNASPLLPPTPRNAARPTPKDRWMRFLDRYRVAGTQMGFVSVRAEIMRRLPPFLQRAIYRHELSHIRFQREHLSQNSSRPLLGRWIEEFLVSSREWLPRAGLDSAAPLLTEVYGETGRQNPEIIRWLRTIHLSRELMQDIRILLRQSPDAWDFEAIHRLIEIFQDPRVDDTLVDHIKRLAPVAGLSRVIRSMDMGVFDVPANTVEWDESTLKSLRTFLSAAELLADAARSAAAGHVPERLAQWISYREEDTAKPLELDAVLTDAADPRRLRILTEVPGHPEAQTNASDTLIFIQKKLDALTAALTDTSTDGNRLGAAEKVDLVLSLRRNTAYGVGFKNALDSLLEGYRQKWASLGRDVSVQRLFVAKGNFFHPQAARIHAHRRYAYSNQDYLRRRMNHLRLQHGLLRGVRLIATDIDNTLAPHNGAITPGNETYLREALALGLPLVFITGKSDMDHLLQQQIGGFISRLSPQHRQNVFLFTGSGSRFYRFDEQGAPVKEWEHPVLSDPRTRTAVRTVVSEVFEKAAKAFHLDQARHKPFHDGDVLDPGPGQAAQQAPLALFIEDALRNDPRLSAWGVQLNVTVGGNGDIGVDPSGKGAAMGRVMERFGLKPDQIFFSGDSFFKFGNDNPVRREHQNIGYAHVKEPKETARYLETLVDKIRTGVDRDIRKQYTYRSQHAHRAVALSSLLVWVAPVLALAAALWMGSENIVWVLPTASFFGLGTLIHAVVGTTVDAVHGLDDTAPVDPRIEQLIRTWTTERSALPLEVVYQTDEEMEKRFGNNASLVVVSAKNKVYIARRWAAATRNPVVRLFRPIVLAVLLNDRLKDPKRTFRFSHYFWKMPASVPVVLWLSVVFLYRNSLKPAAPSLWARHELYQPVTDPAQMETPDISDNFLGKLEYDLAQWRKNGSDPAQRPVVYMRNTGGGGDVLNNIYLAEKYRAMGAEVVLISVHQKKAGLKVPRDKFVKEENATEEDPLWKWDPAQKRYVYDDDAGYGRGLAETEFIEPVNGQVFRVTRRTRIKGADIPIAEANLVEFMRDNYGADNFFMIGMKDSPEEVAQAEYDLFQKRFAGRNVYVVITGCGGDFISNESEWKCSPVNEEFHMLVLRQMLKRYSKTRKKENFRWRSMVFQESSPGADLESTPAGMQKVLDDLWSQRILIGTMTPWENQEGVRKAFEAVALGIASSANLRFINKIGPFFSAGNLNVSVLVRSVVRGDGLAELLLQKLGATAKDLPDLARKKGFEGKLLKALNALIQMPDLQAHLPAGLSLPSGTRQMLEKARAGTLSRFDTYVLNRILLQSIYPRGTRPGRKTGWLQPLMTGLGRLLPKRVLSLLPLPGYFRLRGKLIVEGTMQRDDTYTFLGKDIQIPGGSVTRDSLFFHWSRTRDWLVKNTGLPPPSVAKHLPFKELAVQIESTQGSTREGIKPTEAEFDVLALYRALRTPDRAPLMTRILTGRTAGISPQIIRNFFAEFEPMVFNILGHSLDLRLQIMGDNAQETEEVRAVILHIAKGLLDRSDLPYELTRKAATLLKLNPLRDPAYSTYIFPRRERLLNVDRAIAFAQQIYQWRDARPLADRLRAASTAQEVLTEALDFLLNPHNNPFIHRNIQFNVFDLADRAQKELTYALPGLSGPQHELVDAALNELNRMLKLRQTPKSLSQRLGKGLFAEALWQIARRYEKTELHRHISGSLSPLLLMVLYWRNPKARQQFLREVLHQNPSAVPDIDAFFAEHFGGPDSPADRDALSRWLSSLPQDDIRLTNPGFVASLQSFFGSDEKLQAALKKAKNFIEYRPKPKKGSLKTYVEFLATGEIVLRNDPAANRVAFRESVLEEFVRDNVTLMELQVSGLRPGEQGSLEDVVSNYMAAFDDVEDSSAGHAKVSAIVVARKEPAAVLTKDAVDAAQRAGGEFAASRERAGLSTEEFLDELAAWLENRVIDPALSSEEKIEERRWLGDFIEQLRWHQKKRGLTNAALAELVFLLEATRREQTRRAQDVIDLKKRWATERPHDAERIVGIGSVGWEGDFFPWTLLPAMRLAKKNGLKNSIHVGEAWAEGEEMPAMLRVKQIVTSGHLDRLEHGTILGVIPRDFTQPPSAEELGQFRRLQRDLLTFLAQTQIAVVTMPTSNVNLSIFGNYARHLLQFFFKQALRVAVAQDNSWIFHTRGSPGERVKVWLAHPDMTFAEWLAIEQNGFENAFTPNNLQGLDPILEWTEPNTPTEAPPAAVRPALPAPAPSLKSFLAQRPRLSRVLSLIGFNFLRRMLSRLLQAARAFGEFLNDVRLRPGGDVSPLSRSLPRSLRQAYAAGETDQYLRPLVLVDDQDRPMGRVTGKDVLLSFNARADGPRQLLTPFARPASEEFSPFHRAAGATPDVFSLTEVPNVPQSSPLLPRPTASETLGSAAVANGIKTAVVVSEKHAPRIVSALRGNHAAEPAETVRLLSAEASPQETAETVAREMRTSPLVIAHFGGVAEAAGRGDAAAVRQNAEQLDSSLEKVLAQARRENAVVLVTSDRGLAEHLGAGANPLPPLSTKNPVPFHFYDPALLPQDPRSSVLLRTNGSLADVAPTALQALGIQPPADMTGRSLLPENYFAGRTPRKVVLLLVEGLGENPDLRDPADPLRSARLPILRSLAENYPKTLLAAQGQELGLSPEEPADDSTGFFAIAAGRAPPNAFERLRLDPTNKVLTEHSNFLQALRQLKSRGDALHLFGTLSPSEIHSSLEHVERLLLLAKAQGIENVYLHVVLDGVDAPPRAGLRALKALEKLTARAGVGKIVTVMGREYGMNDSGGWSKTAAAYQALVEDVPPLPSDPKTDVPSDRPTATSTEKETPVPTGTSEPKATPTLPIPAQITPCPPVHWAPSNVELVMADLRGWVEIRDGKLFIKNVGRQALLEQVERGRSLKSKGTRLMFALLVDFSGQDLSAAQRELLIQRLARELGIPETMMEPDLLFDAQRWPTADRIAEHIQKVSGSGGWRAWKVWILADALAAPWWEKVARRMGWPTVAFKLLDVGVRIEVAGAALDWLQALLRERYHYTDDEISRLLAPYREGRSVVLPAEKVGMPSLEKLRDEQQLFDIQA
ncbi:MAG TPA: glucosamine-6-phosphate deaminase [Elusimicrobiota bacterium]|nr:glucosamine-6-phosphate deaminase [Elusimicrobiota bacterium]